MKSTYGLNQASQQWYIKFYNVIVSYGFIKNIVDQYIYIKFSRRKYVFLLLYIDVIVLTSSDFGLLHETKQFLSQNFDTKDLSKASYIIGIEIHRDKSQIIFRIVSKSLYWKSFGKIQDVKLCSFNRTYCQREQIQ